MIPSARLKEGDYASPGYYFVTICTKAHHPFFGEIVDGEMRLSAIGKVVAEEWLRTEQIRPNVRLDEWVIMPNHMHAILIINDDVETPRRGVSTGEQDIKSSDRGVSTSDRGVSKGSLSWKSGTLGAIINQFKSKCTKIIRANGYPDFAWQSRFYDHVIRDEVSLKKILKYIRGNAERWELDDYHPRRFQQ